MYVYIYIYTYHTCVYIQLWIWIVHRYTCVYYEYVQRFDALIRLHAEICTHIHKFVGKICIERIVAEVFNDSNIVLTWHVPRRDEGDRDFVVIARTGHLHSTQTYIDVRTQDTQTSEEHSTHNVCILFRPRWQIPATQSFATQFKMHNKQNSCNSTSGNWIASDRNSTHTVFEEIYLDRAGGYSWHQGSR